MIICHDTLSRIWQLSFTSSWLDNNVLYLYSVIKNPRLSLFLSSATLPDVDRLRHPLLHVWNPEGNPQSVRAVATPNKLLYFWFGSFVLSVCFCFSSSSSAGSWLLPQYGNHAPRRQTAQRHDRSRTQEGMRCRVITPIKTASSSISFSPY